MEKIVQLFHTIYTISIELYNQEPMRYFLFGDIQDIEHLTGDTKTRNACIKYFHLKVWTQLEWLKPSFPDILCESTQLFSP